MVGRDPNDPGLFVLAHRRSILGELQTSLTYRLEKVVECGCCRIVWGERSALAAEDVCEPLSRKEKEDRAENGSKFRQACQFLQTVLQDGPQRCRDVKAAAAEACLSERTLERAAAALGLEVLCRTEEETPQRKVKVYHWALSKVGGLAELT